MRIIIAAIIALNFVACSHTPPQPQAQWTPAPPPRYAFQIVDHSRNVNAEVKKSKKAKAAPAPEKKFVAITTCPEGQKCNGQEPQKLVPYSEFAANMSKAMEKNKDIVDRQQRLLAQGLERLKQDRKAIVGEKAYFEHQINTYKVGSLKPVMDGYKKAHVAVVEDLKSFDSKIQKLEKGLDYLNNVKGIRIGHDESTEKLMEMIEQGRWSFGWEFGPEHNVIGKFFQDFGHQFAAN